MYVWKGGRRKHVLCTSLSFRTAPAVLFSEFFVDNLNRQKQNPTNSSHFQYAFMTIPCKHPIVKIVSRDEDAEFVECQACGEIFDSTEFRDIAIEESASAEEES